jgi:hypothetical protein
MVKFILKWLNVRTHLRYNHFYIQKENENWDEGELW